MRALVAGKTVRCELDGEHTYDRCVAVCYLEGKHPKGNFMRTLALPAAVEHWSLIRA
jgi:endonuclease YncB( thermonuclease family)